MYSIPGKRYAGCEARKGVLVKSPGRTEKGSGCGRGGGGNWLSNGSRGESGGAVATEGGIEATLERCALSSSSSSTRSLRGLLDACREKGTSGELLVASTAGAADVEANDAPGGLGEIGAPEVEDTTRFEAETDCTEGAEEVNADRPLEAPDGAFAPEAERAMSGSTSELGAADD